VIEEDEEDEDEGPAPSSGEFPCCIASFELCGLFYFISDPRGTIAKLEPRFFYVSASP